MLFEYETERLLLKIVRPEQAQEVLDFYFKDRELFEKYEPDRVLNFYTPAIQKQILTYEYNGAIKGTMFRYYVYRKQAPKQMIGTISFHNIQKGIYSNCEIGYKFSSEFQHMGYATEALKEIVDLIFCDLQLHKILAYAMPENTASIRLLERAGFEKEGVCRDHLFLHNKWEDHVLYSVINPY